MRTSLTGPLARNTAWTLAGQGLRTVLQGVYFVVIASALGPTGYGALAAVLGLVGVLYPFATLGSGYILVKQVARDPTAFGAAWGRALLMTLVSGLVLIIAVLPIALLVLPGSIPLLLVAVLAGSELLFARYLDLSTQAFQAFQRLDRMALLHVLLSTVRLGLALGLTAIIEHPTPLQWGGLFLLSSVLVGLTGILLVQRDLGKPDWRGLATRFEFREGVYFSISHSAQSIYNDVDKTMLARLSTLQATGIYTAAYRIVDVTFVPMRSLLLAAYARFFQHGTKGISGTIRFAFRLLPFGALYASVAGVLLYLVAPMTPLFLGGEYQHAVEALRWLCVLPLLKAAHYLAADALTGAGHQATRSGIQVLVALVNVAANLWMIPRYSWRGAAWTSIGSDALLVVLLWGVLLIRHRSSPLDAGGG